MTWYDKGSWNCSLVGWAVKLAGCLSKQQLSNQAPTKAARANNEHFQIPWPLMAFQTIFDSNVLWTDLVTLWRNCALSSFHNFECVYCSKKREGSLEAVRESVYSTQIILRRVFCYDLITTTHQFISLKSCSNIQEGSSKVVLLCPVIVVFTNFFLKIITAKQF